MSLVAYGSSDEDSENEEIQTNPVSQADKPELKNEEPKIASKKLNLPTPKHITVEENDHDDKCSNNIENKKLLFNLPKPRGNVANEIVEEDDILPIKPAESQKQKPFKKNQTTVKITIPSLSDFKDVEEDEMKRNKIHPSKKGTGLFAILPPPKGSEVKSTKLIPQAVNKIQKNSSSVGTNMKTGLQQTSKKIDVDVPKLLKNKTIPLNYDSNSDDEDSNDKNKTSMSTDFFSLTEMKDDIIDVNTVHNQNILITSTSNILIHENTEDSKITDNTESTDKKLINNVMDLSKDEIILKNKAEVGPKLPVPEQEYHLDSEGNVAIDEKAIEYLCGKRGIKRKNLEFNEANIIEIKHDDIKPDEREWLVKALTEEQVQRPVSVSGGPSSQSKKKHQITYLAHQAKAMEVELKNQWAQNRVSRNQTRSKYGF